jgi:hypothetical protein
MSLPSSTHPICLTDDGQRTQRLDRARLPAAPPPPEADTHLSLGAPPRWIASCLLASVGFSYRYQSRLSRGNNTSVGTVARPVERARRRHQAYKLNVDRPAEMYVEDDLPINGVALRRDGS